VAEFDLQRILEGIDDKVTDARDRVIKLEGRFDQLESTKVDIEHRLAAVEKTVDAMQEEKAGMAAVVSYRHDLTNTRRWIAGLAVMLAGLALSTVALALSHL
jgi:hypothetical protein